MSISARTKSMLENGLADSSAADELVGQLDAPVITGRSATGAVVERVGATTTEGLTKKVMDVTVTLTNAASTALATALPAGAVILSVQANLEEAVVGDGSGDNGLTKVGIGVSGDPDAYGLSAALTANTKIDKIPSWAALAASTTLGVYACDNAGAAVTEKFVAGSTVRVVVTYYELDSLDNAA